MTWNKASLSLAAVILLLTIGLQSATAQTESASTCETITLVEGGVRQNTFALTTDEQRVVYGVPTEQRNTEYYSVSVNGGEKTLLYREELGLADSDFQITSDDRVVVETWRPTTNFVIFPADGSEPPSLLLGPIRPGGMLGRWYIEADRLYYFRGSTDYFTGDYVFDLATHELTRAVVRPSFGRLSLFSDNGQRVLYSVTGGNSNGEQRYFYSANADTGEMPTLVAGPFSDDLFIPLYAGVAANSDANAFVWSSVDIHTDAVYHFYSDGSDPSNPRELFKSQFTESYGMLFASQLPHLGFIDDSAIWLANVVVGELNERNILYIPVDESKIVPLLDTPAAYVTTISRGSDITLFFVMDEDGFGSIYRLTGYELARLNEDQFVTSTTILYDQALYVMNIQFSADGERIVYVTQTENRMRLRSASLRDKSDVHTIMNGAANQAINAQPTMYSSISADGLRVVHHDTNLADNETGALYYTRCH